MEQTDARLPAVVYCVNGLADYTFNEAAILYKTRYGNYQDFSLNVLKHEGLNDFGEQMGSIWDDIVPLPIQEALQIRNVERRRVAFACIGVERIFTEMQPELLKAETVIKINHRWNERNELYTETIHDRYELYRIAKEKLFAPDQINRAVTDAFAVRCWCTTTKREYFIYVPENVGIKSDPIEAIAWTIRLNITDPVRIYRQGDIILAEAGLGSKQCAPYHLNREQYLSLLYAET